MNQPTDQQMIQIQEIWTKIYQEAAPSLDTHTIPIFHKKDESIKLRGTGVLIEFESEYFLVSAAHVLEMDISDQILIQSSEETLQPLNKFAKLSSHINELADRKYDKIDLAVIKFFSSELLDQLRLSKQFLSANLITENHQDNEGLVNYMIFGYPEYGISIKSQIGFTAIDSEIMVLPTRLSGFKDFEKYGCNSNDHLFVEHFKNATLNNGKKSLKNVEPNGVSGCGLWYIDSNYFLENRAIKYYLVGITIEYQKKYHRVLIATKMHFVLKLLKAHVNMSI